MPVGWQCISVPLLSQHVGSIAVCQRTEISGVLMRAFGRSWSPPK